MDVNQEEARLRAELTAAVDTQAVHLLLNSSCSLLQILLIGMLDLMLGRKQTPK
jgi:hypothetical protein